MVGKYVIAFIISLYNTNGYDEELFVLFQAEGSPLKFETIEECREKMEEVGKVNILIDFYQMHAKAAIKEGYNTKLLDGPECILFENDQSV
jgi:hypothetical protein